MKVIVFEPIFEDWRTHAREALASGHRPDEVIWSPRALNTPAGSHDCSHDISIAHPESGTLFDEPDPRFPAATPAPLSSSSSSNPSHSAPNSTRPATPLHVPATFLEHARYVSFHRDVGKWTLMYRLLWRLAFEDKRLLERVTDDDVMTFSRMRRVVWIDEHHMHAYVRFKKTQDSQGDLYLAWHAPNHPIVRLGAPFFVRRFQAMRWAIFTDDESAFWDGQHLRFGPGKPRATCDVDDGLEDLWRTYYASIFNPARLNVRQLKHKIPPRVWADLPEGRIFSRLIDEAPSKVASFLQSAAPSAQGFLPGSTTATWEELRDAAHSCRGCALWQDATQVVFGEGPVPSDLVCLGEQPGEQEDESGRAFIGPAGQVLNEAFACAGILRESIYLTNAVKHFKFKREGKRRIHQTPGARESAACRPWLEREMALVRPRVLVCLGATAAQTVFGRPVSVEREGGVITSSRFADATIVTFHPSAILRTPDAATRELRFARLVEDLKKAQSLRSRSN